MVAGYSLRESFKKNRKYCLIGYSLIKPTIKKIKNQTKKIIKNIRVINE